MGLIQRPQRLCLNNLLWAGFGYTAVLTFLEALKLAPCRIGVADPDLYCLPGNIPESALAACTKMPEEIRRFIRPTMARREPYLTITCVNSKAGEVLRVDGNLQTTKASPAEHGYGLWTVKRIVGRCDGIQDAEYDETTFTITLALKDRQRKA